MKCARFTGQGQIEIIPDAPMPELESDEIIVRVRYCGLCGSDKRIFRDGHSVIPGHEIAGTVHDIGSCTDVEKGARGVIYIPLFCGKCHHCATGYTNRCKNTTGLIGWQLDGGFAEFVKVPRANFLQVPDSLDLKEAVLLLDTIGTAAHGIRLATRNNRIINSTSAVLVQGCGPLGLGSILVLQAMGFESIYVTDPAESRINMALEFGASCFEGSEEEVEFPLIIEASGNHTARNHAMETVEPGGSVVFLGESNDPWTITPSPTLRRKDCYYIRSFYFPINEFSDNVNLLLTKRDIFTPFTDTVVSLDQLQKAFMSFTKGEVLKPLVKL
ncbi:alcohol dehydrogenase catalytic domain-containing protein [Alicyclobacillus dauci]|uniref:Alcohol dehydrogenase catalytic domain-containing protein n=1 Tax=Alicyclobacillus dauci TaxID=1475485 RepID=A0ABY6YY61_9BACL|nr:alcohol dehydrogenase catalytic domain-containing protein [Alicyclobacillus dauci]WAH35193.1 alcohol dehydrogenase catalytic domain-containing protein [Alicyclobacillus dauci]